MGPGRRTNRLFAGGILAAVAAAAWARARPFRVEVAGHSMAPELLPGDFLVATRGRAPRRGDLVVLEHPERPGFELVKRVQALPGEAVAGLEMGSDEVYVVGVNATGSTDSRSFGPASLAAVKGVVRLRYWPPGRLRRFRSGPAPV